MPASALMFRDMMPDTPIAFDNGAQEIYCDGVATIEGLGHNFRTTYYTWGRQPGQTVYIRIPVVRLIRPLDSVIGMQVMANFRDLSPARH